MPMGMKNGCEHNKTAVILVGGKSSRFGSDKAHAKIDGVSFVEKIVGVLRPLGFQIFLGVSTPKTFMGLDVSYLKDPLPGEGPLQALYGALSQLNTHRILLLACDMPFISDKVVTELWDKSSEADICMLEFQKKIYPLPGVYSKNVLSDIRRLLELGRKDLKALLECGLKVKKIVSDAASHININTLEDHQYLSWRSL